MTRPWRCWKDCPPRRLLPTRVTMPITPGLFQEMFGQHIVSPPVVTSTIGLKAPPNWRWSQLTEVARLATGHTPSRRRPEWWGGNIPWISLTDIRELDGAIATTTSECVNEEGIENSSSVKLPKGTVCFSRTASASLSSSWASFIILTEVSAAGPAAPRRRWCWSYAPATVPGGKLPSAPCRPAPSLNFNRCSIFRKEYPTLPNQYHRQ